ncbi:unannotated protein [freshwater metagenome]|uniref:Unannotated protein n=1 Tax=freshwater metagenome TaxID=449393 RepID=A0A6J6WAM3_9ZZZZ
MTATSKAVVVRPSLKQMSAGTAIAAPVIKRVVRSAGAEATIAGRAPPPCEFTDRTRRRASTSAANAASSSEATVAIKPPGSSSPESSSTTIASSI